MPDDYTNASSPDPEALTPFPRNESEIRQTVLDYNAKKRCFDKRPIKYMTMTSLTPMPAYRYILETFTETRVIGTKSIPFRGQNVPASKSCPEKWSVKVPPPSAPPGNAVAEFKETSNIIKCPTCAATGKIVCEDCGGVGTIMCLHCFGRGYNTYTTNETDGKGRSIGSKSHTQTCSYCEGSGRLPCLVCNLKGWLTCPQCEGQTQVILWNILTVTWVMDVKTYNTARGDGDLTHELLDKCLYSNVEVTQLSSPEDPRPLDFRSEPEITTAAKNNMSEMMKQTDWRVIALRQAVVIVPVVKVEFTWKDVVDRFYVYGAGRRVHFPNPYPGCCCGAMCCCGNLPCAIV